MADAPVADPLADEHWATWLAAIFPSYCSHPFGEHHQEFWEWAWSIVDGERPETFVGVWPRGGAKSTSAEAATAALGARGARRYALYVCDTQDRADDHVGNIASMLESDRIELFYPEVGERYIGKFGNSKGWRRNRLRCANGFTVDAIGLDTASRGVKLEDQRPDLLVIDDIDGKHDSDRTTRRKIDTLTTDLIPAGSDDRAVLAIQNLIHRDGVFARLVDGRADFLRRRIVSGPVPALRNMTVAEADEGPVVDGDPTWAGQDVEACQAMVEDMGLRAFRTECQHDVAEVEGSLLSREQIDAARVDESAELESLTIGVDPSGGDGPDNDEVGIVAVARGEDRHGYIIADRSGRLGPTTWARRALLLGLELAELLPRRERSVRIVGEDNYGGAMVVETLRVQQQALVSEGVTEAGLLTIDKVHASKSKRIRAEPVVGLMGEKDRPESWANADLHMVGVLLELEAEWTGWDPETSTVSPNRLDACVFAVHDRFKDRMRGRKRSRVVVRAA